MKYFMKECKNLGKNPRAGFSQTSRKTWLKRLIDYMIIPHREF